VHFIPKSDAHAIVEVVFGLQLARPLHQKEIEALVKAHGRWRSELPKVGRQATVSVMLGDGPPPPELLLQPPAAGVTFDRIQPDGTLGWRLRAGENNFFVNCLDYDSWDSVWAKALRLLTDACDVSLGSDNAICGIVLQYIDEFIWQGDASDYDPLLLLRSDSPYIPRAFKNRGQNWHLNQGWFRTDNLPVSGRILERMNVEGLTLAGIPTVRMDNYLRLEPETAVSGSAFFEQGAKLCCDWFSHLHDQNKSMLRNYITTAMAQRISLNA